MDHHSLIVHHEAVEHERLRDRVGVRAGQAMDEHFSTTPMLREPRTVLQRIVDAGMLDELAPAWVVVATKGEPAAHVPDYPAIVAAEPETDNPWSTVAVVSFDDTETLSWASARTDDEMSEGKLSRTLVPSTRRTLVRARASTGLGDAPPRCHPQPGATVCRVAGGRRGVDLGDGRAPLLRHPGQHPRRRRPARSGRCILATHRVVSAEDALVRDSGTSRDAFSRPARRTRGAPP